MYIEDYRGKYDRCRALNNIRFFYWNIPSFVAIQFPKRNVYKHVERVKLPIRELYH